VVTLSSKLCSAIRDKVQRQMASLDKVSTAAAEAAAEAAGAAGNAGEQEQQQQDARNWLVDDPEEVQEQQAGGDLPPSMLGLKQRHFPLCLTLTALIDMLDSALQVPFLAPSTGPKAGWHSGSDDDEDAPAGSARRCRRRQEVTFDRFLAIYWRQMNRSLTKGMDPALVFTEIVSCIKGSPQMLDSPRGRLDRDAYEHLPAQKRSLVEEHQRPTIYQLFELYEKLKVQAGDYDVADRTWHLYW